MVAGGVRASGNKSGQCVDLNCAKKALGITSTAKNVLVESWKSDDLEHM